MEYPNQWETIFTAKYGAVRFRPEKPSDTERL